MPYVKPLFFWVYKDFHNRFKYTESPKCVEFNIHGGVSTERRQINVEKSKFGKFNHENDVIYDAHKVICNLNQK